MLKVREELHLEVQLSDSSEIAPVQPGGVDLCKLSSRWQGEHRAGCCCCCKQGPRRMSSAQGAAQSEMSIRDQTVSPSETNVRISHPSHKEG